jgi:hypothetical protein
VFIALDERTLNTGWPPGKAFDADIRWHLTDRDGCEIVWFFDYMSVSKDSARLVELSTKSDSR